MYNTNIFQQIKNSVTTRDAAEAYGLVVSRNGMTCCPFHDDRHPSMKVDERFHCFACGADGDVIDFASRYHGIRPLEAAYSLAADFGVPVPEKMTLEELLEERRLRKPEKEKPEPEDTLTLCFATLTDYIRMLDEWETRYAPREGEPIHPRFTAATKKLGLLRYIQDILLTGPKDEQDEAAKILKEDYVQFKRELDEYRNEKNKETGGGEEIDEWWF
ncbi:MAG: DNA primase [Clostridia bacterium]|nr:DNA primase [Clostridia bacterium]